MRPALLAGLLLAGISGLAWNLPARAAAAAAPPPAIVPATNLSPTQRAALLSIAKQFVTKFNQDLETAQAYLDKLQPDDLRLQKEFDAIPDGETLLLQIKVGDIGIDSPVTAIKQGHDVMISLADFATAANFPITVDPVLGKADGWFIREAQAFHLDSKTGLVTSKGKTFPIAAGDVKLQDGDLLIKGQSLAKWFDFNLTVDIAAQGMMIKSAQKFPVEEKADRLERSRQADYVQPPPHLPRLDTPPKFFATPNVDVSLTEGYARQLKATVNPSTGEQTKLPSNATSAFTVETNGDLGKLTDRTVINGDAQNEINSVRSTYSRASDSSNLLGPLHARYYEFGDVSPPIVPLAAPGSAGIGVHATNKDPFVTTDTSTQVTGEATPGWDVELYRDDQYISLVTVGQDGRYTFPNVLLFAGDNHFRVEEYGPQGQMKEETKVVTVTPQVYSASGGAYDVAATLQNTQTYLKGSSNSDDPDKGSPAIVASYAHQLTHDASGQVDLQTLQQNGTERGFLHGGVADTFGKTIVNFDTAVESNASYTGAVSARRTFGLQSVLGSVQYASPNYNAVGNLPIPSATNFNLSVQGPIPLPLGSHPSYQASTDYVVDGDGGRRSDRRLGLNTRVGGLSLSNSITDVNSSQGDVKREVTTGNAAVRGNALGVRWRASANYDVRPTQEVTEYAIDLNKIINQRLSTDLNLVDDPLVPSKKGTFSLSYTGNHAVFAPSLSYDSKSNLTAFLNMRFGLTRNPYTNDIFMTSKPVGDSGSLAARVFLDKDGDNKFGPGDELLEGVTVEAVHADQIADTDKHGEAFLNNLPVGKLTDVIVESGSNFDPSWVSGIPGVSVRPRPGHVDRVDFPIHIGGTMDGIIYARLPVGPPRAVKDIDIALYDGDGKLALSATTAYDGYFTVDAIPPGDYFLIVNEKEARGYHLVRPPPEPIHVGYEGTVFAKHNIYLDYGEGGDVSVAVEQNLGDYPTVNPTIDRAPLRNQVVVLNLGTYNSRVLMAVVWYKLKTRYAALIGDARLLVQPADSFASPKTGKNILRAALSGYNVQDAWNRCRALNAHGEQCAVEILPKGVQDVSAADAAATAPGSK